MLILQKKSVCAHSHTLTAAEEANKMQVYVYTYNECSCSFMYLLTWRESRRAFLRYNNVHQNFSPFFMIYRRRGIDVGILISLRHLPFIFSRPGILWSSVLTRFSRHRSFFDYTFFAIIYIMRRDSASENNLEISVMKKRNDIFLLTRELIKRENGLVVVPCGGLKVVSSWCPPRSRV